MIRLSDTELSRRLPLFTLLVSLCLVAIPAIAAGPASGALMLAAPMPTTTPDNTSSTIQINNPVITYGMAATIQVHLADTTNGGTTVNGGTVTFTDTTTSTVLGSATVSGGIASISPVLGVAAYEVQATYAGNANFNGSTSGTGTMIVNQKTVVVTVLPQTITYGQLANLTASSGTVTVSGLIAADSAQTPTLAMAGGTVTSFGVPNATNGTPWTIQVSAGTINSTNYQIILNNGTLTVNKKSITVTADPKTITYPASFPAFSTTVNALVSGDTSQASVGTTGVPTTNGKPNAGSYTITATAGQISTSNYSITFNTGTFTVNQAPLTVTANNASFTYGGSLPTLSVTVSGFVNGDNAGNLAVNNGSAASPTAGALALTGTVSLTTTATGSSSVNTYAITSGSGAYAGLSSSNYSLTFVPGTLTVNKAPLTVAVQPQTITYGQHPNLSGTSSAAVVVTGLVNGDTINTSTPGLSTNATTSFGFENATNGTPWTITPNAGTISTTNYNISYTPATANLTVSKLAITVTATAQTITYGNSPNLTAGSGTVTVSTLVTGDTNAPSLSTNATLTNGKPNATNGTPWAITPAAGTISQSNYSFTFTPANLTVSQVQLTVSADTPTAITYGNANPTFTATITGFVNSDTRGTAISGNPGFASNATTTNSKPNAGTWTITPSVGGMISTNYSFLFSTGSYVVNQVPLTITAGSLSYTYGSTLPPLLVNVSGFVNGDNGGSNLVVNNGSAASPSAGGALALTGTVNLATTATGSSSVGTYPVISNSGTYAGLSSSNYSLSFVAGTFTITQAPLTVTVQPQTITFGQFPNLTGTSSAAVVVTGLVNGDVIATSTPSLSTNATTSFANLYPNATNGTPWTITATAGTISTTNYNITFVPANLTVSKLAISVTASGQTITYGNTPNLTAGSGTVTVSTLVTGDSSAPSLALANNTTYTNSKPNATNGTPWSIVPSAGTISTSNYSITFNNGALAVSQVPLTITATSTSKNYGTLFTGTAFTTSGLVNGDGVASVTVTSTGAPVTATVAGSTYPLVPSAAVASGGTLLTNYSITYSNGALTVSPVGLTVTANSRAKFYGTAVVFAGTEFTTVGLLNSDAVASVTLTSAGIGAFVTVGPYPIVPSAATGTGLTNYTISYVNGTLTINSATLTVNAGGATRPFGTANSLGYNITGFLGSDTVAVVSGVPFLNTPASINSAPGTYTVTPSAGTLSATNYIFAFPTGTLIIVKAAAALGISGVAPGIAIPVGQSFTINFIAVGAPLALAPTGTVSYTVDGGAAQNAVVVNGVASATIPGLTLGSHSIGSLYSGDVNYLGTSPTAMTLTVTKGTSQLSVSVSPAITQLQGQSFTLNFTAVGAGATAALTGSVSCTVDGGAAQQSALTAGSGSLILKGLSLGTHTVLCTYSGDPNYPIASASSITLTVTAAPPAILTGGVVNAANGGSNVAPGGLLSIYGSNLLGSVSGGGITGVVSPVPVNIPTTVSNTQVLINGAPAPLLYVSSTQINCQAPAATPLGSPVQVVAVVNGVSSLPVSATFTAYAPAVFTYQRTATSLDPVIVYNADYSIVTPTKPAKPGDILVIYATGAGSLVNPPADGAPATASPLSTTVDTPVVALGSGASAVQPKVIFSGLAPGFVGLYQLDIQLPATMPAGAGTPPSLPLTITLPGASSASVNLWVSK